MAIPGKEPSSDGVISQAGRLVQDLKGEVKEEATQIKATGEPVNPAHSDRLVRRHVFGLSVSLFVGILLFLVVVFAAIYFFAGHK